VHIATELCEQRVSDGHLNVSDLLQTVSTDWICERQRNGFRFGSFLLIKLGLEQITFSMDMGGLGPFFILTSNTHLDSLENSGIEKLLG
jgi:hypothetical protein